MTRLQAFVALLAIPDEPSLPPRRHRLTYTGSPGRYRVYGQQPIRWTHARRPYADSAGPATVLVFRKRA